MFHIYGFTFSLYGLVIGGTLVTLPRFEPQTFLAAIQRYRVTHLSVGAAGGAVPRRHPLVDSYDLSSLVKSDAVRRRSAAKWSKGLASA